MKLPIPTTGRNKQILYCKYYRIGQSSYERVTINIRKNVKLSEIKEMNRNISFIFSVIDEGGYLSLLSEDVMFSYTNKDFCNKEIILFEKDYNPTKITFVLLFIKCYPEEECIKLTESIYYTKNNNNHIELFEPFVFSINAKATTNELITSICNILHLKNLEVNPKLSDKPIDLYFTQSTVTALYCTTLPSSKSNELILFNTNKIEYINQINLYDCFTELSSSSQTCPVCNSHLTSKSIFTKLPFYFLIQLNRFKYGNQSKKYIKNIDYITYSQCINPIDYIDSKEKYNPYDFLYELQCSYISRRFLRRRSLLVRGKRNLILVLL